MAAQFVSAQIDLSDVERGLLGLNVRPSALRPVFNELRNPLRGDLKDHQAQQEGPGGKWPARSNRTTSRLSARRRGRTASGRRRGRRKAGRLLGKLPHLFVLRVSSYGLSAENRAAWSDIHDKGGTAGRGARIPARPYAWLSDRFLDLSVEFVAECMQLGWGRG